MINSDKRTGKLSYSPRYSLQMHAKRRSLQLDTDSHSSFHGGDAGLSGLLNCFGLLPIGITDEERSCG